MSAADSHDTPPQPVLPVRPAPLTGTPAPHVPEEPIAKVSFAMEQRDLDAFESYARKKQGLRPWRLVLVLMGLAVAVGLLDFGLQRRPGRAALGGNALPTLLTFVLPVGLILLFYVFFYKRLVRAQQRAIKGIFEPRTIGMSKTYLHTTDALHEGRSRWEAFSFVDRGRQHTFFALTKNRGYVVPDRAFTDDASALAFYEQAITYWRAAATNAV